MQTFNEDGAAVAGAVLHSSAVVKAGDFYFVSGRPGWDLERGPSVDGIARQTEYAFANVERSLALAGLGLADVVKVTAYLQDSRDFFYFNEAFGKIFAETSPARTTVVAQAVLDTRIEVDVIAYSDTPKS